MLLTRSTLFGIAILLAGSAAGHQARDESPSREGVQGKRFHANAHTLRRLEELARELDEPGIPTDDGTAAQAPPTSPPRVPPAWQRLERTTKSMTAFLDEYPRPGRPPRRVGGGRDDRDPAAFRALALRSLSQAKRGLRDLTELSTDFPGAMKHLELAVSHMLRARDRAPEASASDFSEESLVQLTDVTARLAMDGIDRAQSAGVDRGQLAEAKAALAAGRQLVAEGNYGDAVDSYTAAMLVGQLVFFDMNKFEQNIRAAFDGQTVGYTYAINANGVLQRTAGLGFARTGADLPLILQSPGKETNIASLSKTVTATALLQLMEARGVSVDDSIAPHLPPTWEQGPGIASLTFRDLLTQRSGLSGNANGAYDDASLRDYIAQGIVPAAKIPIYQNANFALFRILIPYLEYGQGGMMALKEIFYYLSTNVLHATFYIDIVRQRVLNKTGFINAGCAPSDPNPPTLLYRFPHNNTNGFQMDSWTLLCGSGGWFMSTTEIAAFMAHQRFNNAVLSPSARQAMDDGFLGWHDPAVYSWTSGKYGVYRSHGGDLLYNPSPFRGLNACMMNFPFNVQAVVVTNSAGGAYPYQCQVLRDAFDNAFFAP